MTKILFQQNLSKTMFVFNFLLFVNASIFILLRSCSFMLGVSLFHNFYRELHDERYKT